MRISDWSSDVCSSDLPPVRIARPEDQVPVTAVAADRGGWRAVLGAVATRRWALLCLVVLGGFLVVAVVGPSIAPCGANEVGVAESLSGPSLDHPFGVDQLGRDVMSRVLIGARDSLRIGVVAVGIALGVGVIVGLLAGYYRGWLDDALMRLMDVLFAFPAILLAIAVLAVRGPGATNAMIAIGIVYIPVFARVTRASTLALREELFVRAEIGRAHV